jgi:two-component system response regulator TctD
MASRAALKTTPGRTEPATYTCGDVEVDCGARVVRIAGRRQLLTFSEFETLQQLVQSRGRVFTREELHARGCRNEDSSLRAVDTLIARLRRKLRGAQLFQIETVQQIGYRCHWSTSSDLTLGTEQPPTNGLATRE